MAKNVVDAVLTVADLERKDVNFELIKLECKVGERMEDTFLVKVPLEDAESVAGRQAGHPRLPVRAVNAQDQV